MIEIPDDRIEIQNSNHGPKAHNEWIEPRFISESISSLFDVLSPSCMLSPWEDLISSLQAIHKHKNLESPVEVPSFI